MGHGFSECLPSRVNAGEDFVTLAEAEQKNLRTRLHEEGESRMLLY